MIVMWKVRFSPVNYIDNIITHVRDDFVSDNAFVIKNNNFCFV